MKNYLIVIVVVAVLAVVGTLAYVDGHKSEAIPVTASPVGSTFNTAKIAAINFTPSTSAASSTSILNTDSNSRFIVSNFVSCGGTNGQGFTATAATTTTSSNGLQGNTNYAANTVATTSVSSTYMYTASSTEGVIQYTSRIWPSGTYLTFVASAVNSGVCTVGVNYLPS